MKRQYYIAISVILVGLFLEAQAVLTPEDAMALALKHNYDIQVSRRQVAISKNNAHVLNSGYLPSLSGTAGGSIDQQNTEGQLANGDTRIANGVETRRYNAAVNLNYTLFDGLGRLYNYKRLKEAYHLSTLEARQTIETTLLQLFTVYYTVAQLTENAEVLEEASTISAERVLRAKYQFEYGQTTKLEVLNAMVDLNNDSINLINAKQQLSNAKHDLNFILGQAIEEEVAVTTAVNFLKTLEKEVLLEKVKLQNARLLQAERHLAIRQFDVKTTRAQFLPTVGLLGSYGWNEASNNNPLAFLLQNTNSGVSAGVNLSWNLFDGGSSHTRTKNAKINLEIQKLQNEQVLNEVLRNFSNAWTDYKNKRAIYHIQATTIATAKVNFERTLEQFKLGQVNSIAFRQAQINLTTVQLQQNQTKYTAKIAELEVLRIAGDLLNIDI